MAEYTELASKTRSGRLHRDRARRRGNSETPPRGHKLRRAALTAFTLTLVFVSPASAAGGGDGCNPWNVNTSRQRDDFAWHNWDGYFTDDGEFSNTIYKADSAILNYSPWVAQGGANGGDTSCNPQTQANCTAFGGSSVSAWAMLEQGGTQNWCCTYFQAGWIEYYYGNRYTFAEYNGSGDESKWERWLFDPFPINTYHWYEPVYTPGSQYMYQMYLDNYAPVWIQPHASSSFIPNQAQFSGETHTTPDQMPGGTYYHEKFSDPYIVTSVNSAPHQGTYSSAHNTWDLSGGGWFGATGLNTTDFEIWDAACGN